MKRYNSSLLIGAVVWLASASAQTSAISRPSVEQLDAVTKRGRMLAAYDTAAWQATDALMAAYPKAEPSGRYIARLTNAGWVVDFGSLDAAGNRFLVSYEATQAAVPAHFDVKSFKLARQDEGWNLAAARGMETATKDFGRTDRPYNIAALPKQSGGLYVYLYPAQVKAGVYPIGADARYLLSPDGERIIEKRQMHKSIIESVSADPKMKVESGYHTHVLSDVPEDTDVFLVLTRQPRVPEMVVTQHFMYTVGKDGVITVADRPK